MKKLTLLLTFAALTLLSTDAQTIASPKQVTRDNIFTWDDPNVPRAVGYTVYAALAPSTNAIFSIGVTTNRIIYSQLLPASSRATTYTLSVLGWDSAGDASEPSTNYVVLVPKQKLKGMGNLRTQ